MAADEGDKGPGTASDRRPGSSRRKQQPITIDLAASSVRIENPPEAARTEMPSTDVPTPDAVPAAAKPEEPMSEAPIADAPIEDKPMAGPAVARSTTPVEAPASAPEPLPEPVGNETIPTPESAPEMVAASDPSSTFASEHLSEQPASTAFADAEASATTEENPAAAPKVAAVAANSNRSQLVAASLIGGAIGLVAAYGLAVAGLWPGAGNSALTAQMAALDQRLSATEAKVAPNGQLATELDHLKSMPSIPGVTISDVEKILDPFTAKTAAAVAHMDEIDRKIAGEQAIVRGESKAMQETLTTKMAALDNTVSGSAAQTAKLKEDIAKLQQDLAGLDKKTADALGSAQGELSGTIQALSARVTDLDTRTAAELAIVRGTTQKANVEIAKLTDGIVHNDSELNSLRKTLADQTDSIAKLQAQLQPIDDMRKAIDGLGARIGAVDDVKAILAQQTAKLNTADDAKKAADGVAASLWIIDQRIANMQARLTDLDALKTSVAGDAKQLAALDARVAPVEAKVAGLDGYAKQGLDARKEAVAAVAIANLKSAADTGRPFGNELATAKAIAGSMVDLSPLDAYATKGLISSAKIIDGFDAAAGRIADATTSAPKSEGIFGALLSHATATVKVVPTNAEAGDDVAARLSRISAKLKANDLAGALAEWKALPDAAKQASADWGNALTNHVDGTAAVSAISNQVMAKLTTASQ